MLAFSVLKRVANPVDLWRAGVLQWNRKANRRLFDDNRLIMYSKILPEDFLHYGYFEDLNRIPEQMSLADFTAAQSKYAELLIELIGAPAGPVLDIGCGMGGLTRLLHERGHEPVALTPDRHQAAYIGRSQPDVSVLRCKLEAMPAQDHARRFGAAVTAESLQYLNLDKSLKVLDEVLQPGGNWVACDYFLTRPSPDRTCHNWDTFNRQIASAGWKITYQRDITANILPTLAFLHMLATRFGLSLMDFATQRLRRKQPGLHHLFAGLLEHLQTVADDNVALIDPAQFVRDRQYMLLKIERQ